jgi:hypothetical protein
MTETEPAWKIRCLKIDEGCKLLHDLCKERGYNIVTHNSHGFYIDVTLGGKCYMLDPTPDTIWKDGVLVKSYEPGTVIIRDSSHHYERPTQLAEFNILDDLFGFRELSQFLTTLEGAEDANSR